MTPGRTTALFAALGRFSVRHRFAIILGWVALAVVAATLLPSISSVERGSNSQFLPSSAPSARANVLAAPFQSDSSSQATFVAATKDGRPLSAADDAAIGRAESAMRRVSKVSGVVDLGPSPNGRARSALVEVGVRTSRGGKEITTAVSDLRAAIATAGAPAGLAMHLTGALAQSADEQNQSNHIQTLTEVLSIVFIVVLLLITFRALLAPLIALFPSIVALFVAGPVVALSTHIGVQVSDLTPILLTVVMLGAGTDYGLFLIFRLREELRRGRTVHDGVAVALCKVGESITFSGFTVMAALAAVVVSAFGLYQGLGPALAVGIAVALAANLTLLPALLAVFGRATFWPRTPVPGPVRHGAWGRIAARVVARPVATLIIGVVIFGGLSLTMFAYAPTGFGDQSAPGNSDSARGQALLIANYPSAEANPTSVLFRLPSSIWADPSLLTRIQTELEATGKFRQVEGPLDFNGHSVTPTALAAAHDALSAQGPASDLPLQPPRGTAISALVYDAYRSTAQTISPDGRTLQYETELTAGRGYTPAAASAIPAVRTAVSGVAWSVGAKDSGVNGYAASAADVGSISTSDLMHIVPIVLLVLALLLAIVLRSLVAPLYLVASVGLSYLASLGLCVLVFQILRGESGINFVLPFFMFIFILALGQDYNILVMTRIREEAQCAPLRVAVRRAVEATGTTVTSAGLILAGTFGVLTATGDTQVQEIGLGLAAGILLDTFFVRTLLVPSVVVLLGRWNWWPSALARQGGGSTADGEAEVGRPRPEPGSLVIPGDAATVLSPAARSQPLRP
jgi:putative drug exporter of the RND superfamily